MEGNAPNPEKKTLKPTHYMVPHNMLHDLVGMYVERKFAKKNQRKREKIKREVIATFAPVIITATARIEKREEEDELDQQ